MRIAQQTTACDAYHAHRGAGFAASQRERIKAFIALRGGDWSIGELAAALNMEKSTVSARINEMLHETGDLEEKPKRKDRRSAIRIRPVGLTAKQLELIYDIQG